MNESVSLPRRVIDLYRNRGRWPAPEEVATNGNVERAEALIETLKKAEAHIESRPEVRDETLNRVRRRLEQGVYRTPGVLRMTAEKILEEMAR